MVNLGGGNGELAMIRIPNGVQVSTPVNLVGDGGSLGIDTNGAASLATFTGGTSGIGDLTISVTNTNSNSKLVVSGHPINHTGNLNLSNLGSKLGHTGSGELVLETQIGSAVGALTVTRQIDSSNANSSVVLASGGHQFSGPLTVTSGANLLVQSANSLPAGVDVTADGFLSLGGYEVINSLNGTGSIEANGALEVASGNFSGSISGLHTLVKSGSDSLELSGDVVITGGVSVDGGSLKLSGSSTMDSAVVVELSNGATIDISSNLTISELWVDGVKQAVNTYTDGAPFIMGSGSLSVTSGPIVAFDSSINTLPPAEIGTEYNHSLTEAGYASGIENGEDSLQYELLAGPAWLEVVDNELRGTPDSAQFDPFVVSLRVSDPFGASDEQDFFLTVVDPLALPFGWQNQDIGTPGIAGSSIHQNGTFTLTGSGADIYYLLNDECQFAYQSLSGDGEIIARIDSIDNTDPWAKAGLMIRETNTNASAKMAAVVVTPQRGVSFQCRVNANQAGRQGTPSITFSGFNAPIWLKLVRNGDNFSAYYSNNGQIWLPFNAGGINIEMAEEVEIGLVVTSHDNSKICEAVFNNVTVDN